VNERGEHRRGKGVALPLELVGRERFEALAQDPEVTEGIADAGDALAEELLQRMQHGRRSRWRRLRRAR
jgi:hypothetical protein